MIISVHIPKCAGTSFRYVLQRVYGRRLWLNYGADFSREAVPSDTACIHGHIPGRAYETAFPEHRIITMVRHPVQRVISNYYHFLHRPDERNPDCRRLHERKLSLVEFAELPNVRNEATRYVAGRAPDDFDFVGITERYAESVLLYQRMLKIEWPLPVLHDNVNRERTTPTYPVSLKEYDRIAALNDLDLVWYERACRVFEGTLAVHTPVPAW